MKMVLRRRSFLKLVGAAGLSASTLPFARSVFAAEAPRRVIFFYAPDGARPDEWNAQGTGTNFSLPAMTAPLERVREHCLFLSGLDMRGPGSTHEGGVIKLLTGMGADGASANVTPTSGIGVSLDHFLGQKFRDSSSVPHLNLNICPVWESSGHITYDNNGVPVLPQVNPLVAFDSLFGQDSTGGTMDAAVTRKLAGLDHVNAELTALRNRLGGVERTKLDTHTEALSDLQRRLNTAAGSCPTWPFNPSGFQVRNNRNPEYRDARNMRVLADLHMDILVHAFSCGLTRVATLKFGHTVNNHVMYDAGVDKTCHDASHEGGEPFRKVKAWYTERLAELIERLKATPDVDGGNLLDNTLIFMGSCLAHGNFHNHADMPFILAGGRAGGIVTGRSLRFDSLPHNKLLVSIARYMGQNVNQFGSQDPSPGPLAGLTG